MSLIFSNFKNFIKTVKWIFGNNLQELKKQQKDLQEQLNIALQEKQNLADLYKSLQTDYSRTQYLFRSYKDMYQGLAENLTYPLEKQSNASSPDLEFLIISNGRTGSTWLQYSLDRLDNMILRKEIKWKIPGQPEDSTHSYLNKANFSTANIFSDTDIPEEPTNKLILGSKMVFDPDHFISQSTFDKIDTRLPNELRLIFLKRTYKDCFLSWRARGVCHQVDAQVISELKNYDRLFMDEALKRERPLSRILHLTVRGQALEKYNDSPEVLPYPIEEMIDDLLIMFHNDVVAYDILSKKRPFMTIDYSKIPNKFKETVEFAGGSITDAEADTILSKPSVKKLPTLAENIKPADPLESFSQLLDEAYDGVIHGELKADEALKWNVDGSLDLSIPKIAEFFSKYNLGNVSGGKVNWIPHRATVTS